MTKQQLADCAGVSVRTLNRWCRRFDRELAAIFSSYFANFAATGNPNGEGLPYWEAGTDGTCVMELGEKTGMTDDPYLALGQILDKMQSFQPAE